ncbi:MAG: sulfatase activating formylglycine-generating enzyme [Pseudohongiellaceae bacterium]
MTTSTDRDPLHDALLRDVPELQGHKVLDGRYVLVSVLGRGGMGVVYRAHHLGLGVDVAIKCLHPALAQLDPQFVVRFEREARAAARVKHENVVSVRDVAQSAGLHYIAMDFVSGENARQWVRRRGQLSIEQALAIAVGAARGLSAAHQAGLVHRDIKPDNVLVSSSGETKLADLGLAKIAGDRGMTLTGVAMGTPRYMPPEQFEDAGIVGTQADVYSLGATLYFLLVGADGITGETPPEVMKNVCGQEFPRVQAVRPDVPLELDALVARCVHPDLAMRPRDGSALLVELEALAAGFDVNLGEQQPVADGAGDPTLLGMPATSLPQHTLLHIQESLAGAAAPAQPVSEAGQAVARELPPLQLEERPAQIALEQRSEAESFAEQSPRERVPDVQLQAGRHASGPRHLRLWGAAAVLLLGLAGWLFGPQLVAEAQQLDGEPGGSESQSQSFMNGATEVTSLSAAQWVLGQPAPLLAGFVAAGPNAEGYPEYDKRFGGGSAMRFVLLPAGTFLMGSSDHSGSGQSHEGPQHTVRLNAFLIAKTECTQGQWLRLMGHNPAFFVGAGLKAPVEQISWDDIQALEERTGLSLPSESQWEYAARAGAASLMGSDLSEAAWFQENSGGTTFTVATMSANAFGLHDMLGSVSEWCEDTWNDNYAEAPVDGTAQPDGDPAMRVFRGGNWSSGSSTCRFAKRSHDLSSLQDHRVGFRLSQRLP